MQLLEKKTTTSNKHFPRNLIPLDYISGTDPYISNTSIYFPRINHWLVINSSLHVNRAGESLPHEENNHHHHSCFGRESSLYKPLC